MDILHACVMDFRDQWEKHLVYEEFEYNKKYYLSIKKAPLEALYGTRCRSLIGWLETFQIGPHGTYLL